MQKSLVNREEVRVRYKRSSKQTETTAALYLLKTQLVFQDKTKRRKTPLCCLVLRFSLSLRREVFH